jgi:hypothetical protein
MREKAAEDIRICAGRLPELNIDIVGLNGRAHTQATIPVDAEVTR